MTAHGRSNPGDEPMLVTTLQLSAMTRSDIADQPVARRTPVLSD